MEFSTARFSGHQSFTLRNTWLTKGVLGCATDPHLFGRDDALVTLGVGKNMVEAIRYWCLATRVLTDKPGQRGAHEPTALGRRLFLEDGGWDPYLEDTGTLWLIHWLLATHAAYASTICYAFNCLDSPEFTRDGLEHRMANLAERLRVRATPNAIRRDVNVFIRTYCRQQDGASTSTEDILDCPLAELGLLYEEPQGRTYAFARGPKDSLPDVILAFALADYCQQRDGQRTFTFDEIAYEPFAPGRVFKLDELSLAERLERVVDLTAGAWQFTETAGYRQVLLTRDYDPYPALNTYYHGTPQGDSDAHQSPRTTVPCE
ncbi:MAG: DUF4007 family protein [Anaerolineae bacterium]